jgi:enterochelin esterase-like enzyme
MDNKYLKRKIEKATITSRHLQIDKKILVYLPPNYDSTSRYPVIFLHDGNDYFSLGRIATQANQLIDEQKIQPLIMVAIPVDKGLRNSEYSPRGERHHAQLAFITEEILPYMEANYPIDRGQLVVGGSSLGATVSLHLALHQPYIWRNVLAQSGAFLPETIEQLKQQDSLDWLHIYQSVGLGETAVPTHLGTIDLVARNRDIHRILVEKGAHVHYEEQAGEHTWGLWQPQLPAALSFFFGK